MGEHPEGHADDIWNRACDALMDGLPADARSGDVMLVRAIDFDGSVHSGGLLHRVEEDEGLDEAIEALRWFGLLEAATRVEQVRDRHRRLAAEDAPPDAFDELEQQADGAYFEMPQGQVTDQLEAALLARLDEDPTAFSPL